MAKRVTLSTIAKACNTSIGTVSRALTGKADINAETKVHILEVAEQLGYFKSNPSKKGRRYRIGVVYCHQNTYFYDTVTQGINDAQLELQDEGVQIVPLQTEYLDPASQIQLLSSLDRSAYDALIINSASRETADQINRFVEQGLPVATFNTDAPGSRRMFFCGTNSYASGRLGGGILGKLTLGKGKAAVFANLCGNESWSERFCGFCATIQEDFSDIELLPVLEYYKNDDLACQAIKKLLAGQPDIRALFPINLSCTTGALRAIKELGREDLVIVGYDLSPYIIECLQDGSCDAVLYQNPYQQGYSSVMAMAQYLLEGVMPPTSELEIPTSIILKYNIGSVIK